MEILGWIANGLFFLGGSFKSPRKAMVTYMTADIMYISLYAYLDLYLAAFAMAICALRSGLTIILNQKWNFYSLIILTAIACLFVATKAESFYDILLLFATICIGLSCFYREDFVKFKVFLCISQVLWIIHSLVFGVYSMVFCCMIILGTNLGSLLYHSETVRSFLYRYQLVKIKA